MDRRMTILAGAVLVLSLAPATAAQDTPGTLDTAWSTAVLSQPFGVAPVVGVTVGSDLMVAVGQRACDPRAKGAPRCWGQAWVSADGTTWQASDPRDSGLVLGRLHPVLSGPEVGLQGVAYGPAGFLAFGRVELTDHGGQRSAVWVSEDGSSWTRLSDAGTFPRRTRLRTILGTDDGYLLGGVTYFDKAPRAAIWSSPDGRTWSLAKGTKDDQTFEIGGFIDTLEDPSSGGINAFALYPGPTDGTASIARGVVAVGQACMPSLDRRPWAWSGACWGQLWRSDDGRRWRKDEGQRPRPRGATSHAASVAKRLVVDTPICLDTCASALLLTDDDVTWRVAYGSPVDGELKGLVVLDGGFRAILVSHGSGEVGAGYSLAIWTSADGADWTLDASQPVLPVSLSAVHDVDMAVAGDRLVVTVAGESAPDGDYASIALLGPPPR